MTPRITDRLLFVGSHSPIGLDVGSARVKAVQLRRGATGVVAACAACFERRSTGRLTADEARRIRSVLVRRGFTGSHVVLSTPEDLVFAEVVETPPSGSGAPIEQIVRAELARLSGMSPGAFELASWVVPEPDRRTKSARTLGVAVETAALIETITALTKAGLETVATDLGLLGLLRACRQSMPVPSGGAVIVDLGAAAGRVGIVASDTLVYLRSVPELALAPRVERLAHALGVAITDAHALLFPTQPPGPPGPDRGTASVTAALAADIAKAVITCVSYAAHTNRELDPAIIVLAGGGAELPGLSAAVHAQLDTGCVTLRACSDETAGGVALGPGHANAAAMAAWDQAWTAWATPVSIVKEAA